MFRDTVKLAPRDDFILAMRQVASSVSVVTTDGAAGKHGATVSSFSSVSADPPTVLVCLFAKSRIAQAVAENGSFCVNVLSETDSAVADRFAGRHDAEVTDRFSGIEHYGAPGTAPQIEGSTVFHCDVQRTILSGSHVIVLGHVRHVFTSGVNPLTYRDGIYHRVQPQTERSHATTPER